MQLYQTSFDDVFETTIKKWKEEIQNSKNATIIHVYVPYDMVDGKEKLTALRKILALQVPDIQVIGCSATGEIMNGQMNDLDIVVTAMVFEDPGTSVEVFPFYEKDIATDVREVLEYAKRIKNIRGIELLTAAPYQRLEDAGKIMDSLPENVEIFGGVAVGDEEHPQYVFANDCECCQNGSAFVIYSGADLHIQTYRTFGWKPIGYPFTVTSSEGAVVYELDGKPAYEVYNHYLNIEKGKNFFYDALEFPWKVKMGNDTYVRHAKSVNNDGSIVMSTNIPQGSSVWLTYGDPRSIIETTKQTGLLMRDFAPQVVNVINCMGRKLFWSEKENVEIAEISKYMSTTGFSALGEIMRVEGSTVLNNLSIIAVAMREGEKKNDISLDIDRLGEVSNMPMTARLAVFINTITEELMEKNLQLNDMLYKASHDALTGLLNRGAIERIIYENNSDNWHLIMFDVDDFKMINDQYGHSEGDRILKFIAENIEISIAQNLGIEAGRWGGEEFMILLSGHSSAQVIDFSKQLCNQIREKTSSGTSVTISVGTTMHRENESILETINRVDSLLYQAKNQGKNQVCSDMTM